VNNSYFLPLLHSKLLSKSRLLKESTITVSIPFTSKKINLRSCAWILDPKKVKKINLVWVDYLNTVELLPPVAVLQDCCFFQGYSLKISCQVIVSWATGRRWSRSRSRPCFSRGHPFHPLIMSSQLVTLQLEENKLKLIKFKTINKIYASTKYLMKYWHSKIIGELTSTSTIVEVLIESKIIWTLVVRLLTCERTVHRAKTKQKC